MELSRTVARIPDLVDGLLRRLFRAQSTVEMVLDRHARERVFFHMLRARRQVPRRVTAVSFMLAYRALA